MWGLYSYVASSFRGREVKRNLRTRRDLLSGPKGLSPEPRKENSGARLTVAGE